MSSGDSKGQKKDSTERSYLNYLKIISAGFLTLLFLSRIFGQKRVNASPKNYKPVGKKQKAESLPFNAISVKIWKFNLVRSVLVFSILSTATSWFCESYFLSSEKIFRENYNGYANSENVKRNCLVEIRNADRLSSYELKIFSLRESCIALRVVDAHRASVFTFIEKSLAYILSISAVLATYISFTIKQFKDQMMAKIALANLIVISVIIASSYLFFAKAYDFLNRFGYVGLPTFSISSFWLYIILNIFIFVGAIFYLMSYLYIIIKELSDQSSELVKQRIS
ncbi:hypothetical protein [Deinococcus sp.]|uniref:hypothetical protein n=1 Tax=Deinococcus sp. TaxID=47478 RepID=UPI003B5ACA9C